jgi:hypothetical protein
MKMRKKKKKKKEEQPKPQILNITHYRRPKDKKQISHRMNTQKLNPKLKSTTFNQRLNHAYMVEDERA